MVIKNVFNNEKINTFRDYAAKDKAHKVDFISGNLLSLSILNIRILNFSFHFISQIKFEEICKLTEAVVVMGGSNYYGCLGSRTWPSVPHARIAHLLHKLS